MELIVEKGLVKKGLVKQPVSILLKIYLVGGFAIVVFYLGARGLERCPLTSHLS